MTPKKSAKTPTFHGTICQLVDIEQTILHTRWNLIADAGVIVFSDFTIETAVRILACERYHIIC